MTDADVRACRAEKMRALAAFARRFGHDLNNVFSITLGFSELLLADANIDAARQDLQEIAHAATRGVGLVQQILAASGRRDQPPAPFRLADVVEPLVPSLEAQIGPLDVSIDEAARDAIAIGDAAGLRDAITTIAVNAREAMGPGDAVRLRIVRRSGDDPSLARHGMPRGDYACVDVSDTGPGLDDEAARRIFEPFFTTRTARTTPALGLTRAYFTVQDAGGDILVDAAPGKGTTMRICVRIEGGRR